MDTVNAGWYLLFRNILDVSPRTTLELCGIFPVLYVLTFFFMLTKSTMLMKAQESTAVSDSNTNPVHPPNVEIETESLLPANDEKKAGDSREMWRMEEGGKRVLCLRNSSYKHLTMGLY